LFSRRAFADMSHCSFALANGRFIENVFAHLGSTNIVGSFKQTESANDFENRRPKEER
jgi:hypothetical protein